MTNAIKEAQKLEGDALVSLYVIDTRPIGGNQIIRFTTMPDDGEPVVFGGDTYHAVDCEVEGFEWDGRGSFPRPTLKVTNLGGLVSDTINGVGDIVGSTFYRLRTFAKFLDNGGTPDPDAIFPPEIYTIDQRTTQNKTSVEWEMASPMDHLGVKLPRRIVIRDVCTHRYRVYNEDTNTFDYSNATCPYAGAKSFDENGVAVTDKSKDHCGKGLADCRLRFGKNGVLPTRAFPGVAKVRS